MEQAGYPEGMRITGDTWIWSALAVAVGLLTAILDLHTDNLQYLVLFLFVQCAVLGYGRPTHAWRWACLVAVCIPLIYAFNCVVTLPDPRALGPAARLFLGPLVVFFKATHPVSPGDILGPLPAFLPALAGAYAGAGMNRLAAHP
jgi:hypothetical protein